MDTTNLVENNLVSETDGCEIEVSNLQATQGDKSTSKKENISYKQEVLRKLIHLCSISIPVGYVFLSKKEALSILIPLAVLMILIDILTKKVSALNRIYRKYFYAMLRKHEKDNGKILLNGASWVLISAVLTVFIFPKIIAITAFAILIISDISAALIGRKFGRTPLFNKSWEGTAAFMVSAVAVVFTIGLIFGAPVSFFIVGSLSAIVGAFAEAASKVLKTDDNFSIPMSVGAILWIGGLIAQNFDFSFINLL